MEGEEIIQKVSIRTGAIRYRDLGYLLCADDEYKDSDVPHTIVLTRDQGN